MITYPRPGANHMLALMMAIAAVAGCRKPAPPSEPPPLETKPTASDPAGPAEPTTSGGVSAPR
jgi:hypothetical protein